MKYTTAKIEQVRVLLNNLLPDDLNELCGGIIELGDKAALPTKDQEQKSLFDATQTWAKTSPGNLPEKPLDDPKDTK